MTLLLIPGTDVTVYPVISSLKFIQQGVLIVNIKLYFPCYDPIQTLRLIFNPRIRCIGLYTYTHV